jgi:hypothetical protein
MPLRARKLLDTWIIELMLYPPLSTPRRVGVSVHGPQSASMPNRCSFGKVP